MEKSNELGEYIFQITDNAPKKFRFTFATRMQNIMLDITESLYKANYINLSYQNTDTFRKVRRSYQEKARLSIDMLCYISQIARKQQCILPKHYEQISLRAVELKKMLNGWIRSDMKR
ncbi:MAG: four helix bundle protein [Clostridiales bacterium]|nr:four helix bundle protein [Clostridiales bacterium]